MSSINVMGMTSAIFLGGVVTFLFLVGKMNDAGVVVTSGVIQGMPIPIKSRWLWLCQVWTMYSLVISASAAALALAFFRIAQQISEADAKQVVLVFAFITITGSVANLLTDISAFLAFVSILRNAERVTP
ncbi:MAG: hypothetical protein HKN10_18205 [Myxococcales bacterium]|nr:hypothetical protein [Myxococcales bacterium]